MTPGGVRTRTLFATEPDRIKVFAGKTAALTSFVAAGVAATVLVSIVAGVRVAPGAGVTTEAWRTSEGFTTIATTYANLLGAALVPGIAISVGVAWFILGEARHRLRRPQRGHLLRRPTRRDITS